jgi:hypothetical protein
MLRAAQLWHEVYSSCGGGGLRCNVLYRWHSLNFQYPHRVKPLEILTSLWVKVANYSTETLHTVHCTLHSVHSGFCSFLLTFYLLYWDLKSQIGSLFNSPYCHFYSILQTSTIQPTLLLLLILVQYCTPVQYVLCVMFLIRQLVDKSLEGPQRMGKKFFSWISHTPFCVNHSFLLIFLKAGSAVTKDLSKSPGTHIHELLAAAGNFMDKILRIIVSQKLWGNPLKGMSHQCLLS